MREEAAPEVHHLLLAQLRLLALAVLGAADTAHDPRVLARRRLHYVSRVGDDGTAASRRRFALALPRLDLLGGDLLRAVLERPVVVMLCADRGDCAIGANVELLPWLRRHRRATLNIRAADGRRVQRGSIGLHLNATVQVADLGMLLAGHDAGAARTHVRVLLGYLTVHLLEAVLPAVAVV